MDGGQSFFKQDCTLPSDSTLSFTRLDFIDNNIAYAIARNLSGSLFKLLKTTNAGGITSNYITQPLQNVGLTNAADELSLQVSPNPSHGKIHLTWNNIQAEHLEIRTMQGALVYAESIENMNATDIDISELPRGIYFIQIGTHMQRVILD